MKKDDFIQQEDLGIVGTVIHEGKTYNKRMIGLRERKISHQGNVGKNTPKKMKDKKRFDTLKNCKNKLLQKFYAHEIKAYDEKVKKEKKVKNG